MHNQQPTIYQQTFPLYTLAAQQQNPANSDAALFLTSQTDSTGREERVASDDGRRGASGDRPREDGSDGAA
ncbi:MAG: hypothetical protein Q8P67_24890, partial [archaeon]|nr:hypothetical protein [archaeon]